MNKNYRSAPQLETLKPQNELRKLRTGDDSGNKSPRFHFIVILILIGAGIYFANQPANYARALYYQFV